MLGLKSGLQVSFLTHSLIPNINKLVKHHKLNLLELQNISMIINIISMYNYHNLNILHAISRSKDQHIPIHNHT